MANGELVPDDVQDISNQLSVAQHLPPDLMLLKMENESIMAVAQAKPRDPVKILRQLRDLIDAYPEAADEAIYSKPVGTVVRITCGGCNREYEVPYVGRDGVQCPHCESPKILNQKKVKKFAEGLSIRAAESIRSVFGYNRLSITQEILPDGNVKLSGVFVDYATGTITADQRIISAYYTNRFKRPEKHPEDRFLNVIVKAEKAKLRRDVTLDSVPNVIKAAYRDACQKKLESLVTPEIIKEQIIPKFAAKGLNQEQLERIIGRPISMGWTEEDRLRLRTIYTALKNEETTVSELLADLDDDEPTTTSSDKSSAKTNGAVTATSLSSPKMAKSDVVKVDEQKTPDTKQLSHMDLYRAELTKAVTVIEKQAVYDSYFGPDCDLPWTMEERTLGAKIKTEQQLALQAASKKSPPKGQLFDTPQNTAQNAGV